MDSGRDLNNDFVRAIRLLMVAISASILLMAFVVLWTGGVWSNLWSKFSAVEEVTAAKSSVSPPAHGPEFWRPRDMLLVSDKGAGEKINYGRELIMHTSQYLGPEGSVLKMSNGMNCQNCHLDAGTKIFGNNYGAVASTYPKFRARSGTVESIEKRVNDCFERSLNGKSLETTSREMKAIVSYIEWVGSNVEKGESAQGTGLMKLKTLGRAADPAKGKVAYETQCVACHGRDGQGVKLTDGGGYQFPPLWGEHSYNHGAGLYRLSTFAQFVYANMPLGAAYDKPLLTEEQAWDIAAYVNSLPRPGKDLSKDWPDIRLKPFDHPFGPYADPFEERQHKLGPFEPIKDFYADKKVNASAAVKELPINNVADLMLHRKSFKQYH
ncbi:MAG: c-type cytochrome [Cyclobacteriaceae bacterium]